MAEVLCCLLPQKDRDMKEMVEKLIAEKDKSLRDLKEREIPYRDQQIQFLSGKFWWLWFYKKSSVLYSPALYVLKTYTGTGISWSSEFIKMDNRFKILVNQHLFQDILKDLSMVIISITSFVFFTNVRMMASEIKSGFFKHWEWSINFTNRIFWWDEINIFFH